MFHVKHKRLHVWPRLVMSGTSDRPRSRGGSGRPASPAPCPAPCDLHLSLRGCALRLSAPTSRPPAPGRRCRALRASTPRVPRRSLRQRLLARVAPWLALVVLSACSSGAGPSAPASGTAGPTPGTDDPGARRVAGGATRSGLPPSNPADLRALHAAADARAITPALRDALLAPEAPTRAAATVAVARLHAERFVPELSAALADPDPVVRRAASLGLAALEDDAPREVRTRLLGAAATEPDARTRGVLLADLGRVAGPEAESAWRDALSAETPDDAANTPVREGACRGVGAAGLRGRAVEAALLAAVASHAAEDASPAVRLACTWALARQPSPTPSSAETHAALERALRATARDADPEVRLMAARAYGAHPATGVGDLVALAGDPDWRVGAQAFRSLARRSDPAHDGPYADALRAVLDAQIPVRPAARPPQQGPRQPDAQSSDARMAGAPTDAAVGTAAGLSLPAAHVLLVALDEALPVATGVGVAPLADEALRRLGDVSSRATRADGLAHCLAARLVDAVHGWPQRVLRCGHGLVGEAERDVRAAQVLARASGDPAGRAGYLLRLYERGDARVREAVLAATPAVEDVLAVRLVLRGLRESDPGVVTSALEAVVARPARLRGWVDALPSGGPAPPPPSGVGRAQRPAAPLSAEVRTALSAAHDLLRRTDELEGLQGWLDAVAALRDPALGDAVRALEAHTNVAVRRKAATTRQTLATLSLARTPSPTAVPGTSAPSAASAASARPVDAVDAPGATAPDAGGSAASAAAADVFVDASTGDAADVSGETPPLRDALSAADLPRADERLRAVITLASGEVELQLLPDEAPATVARFVQLAERGFYDGLRLHRVVPGFVVQGGDPRGDGYGGPGFSQRCEDNRVRYERGTVGMALAGRDTGGSQFFIAQAAQPHLDGRYTAFARVVRGLDLLDGVLPDDVLVRVRIRRGS